MPKNNYTKVEQALEQGLLKMQVTDLFEAAKPLFLPEAKADQASLPTFSLTVQQKSLMGSLTRDLTKFTSKLHPKLYAQLAIKRSELKAKLINPTSLSSEEWQQLKQIKDKIDLYKAQLQSQVPPLELNQLVENERLKHINKRFNTNEKWLPLH